MIKVQSIWVLFVTCDAFPQFSEV